MIADLYKTLKPTIRDSLDNARIAILDRAGDHAFNLVAEILENYEPLSIEVVCPSLELTNQHLLSFCSYDEFKIHLMDPWHFVRTANNKSYDYVVDLTHIDLDLIAGRDSTECVNHILRNNLLIAREIDKKVLTGHYCKVVPLSEPSTVYESIIADMETALSSLLYISRDESNSDYAILIAMCALDGDRESITCRKGQVTSSDLYTGRDPYDLFTMFYRGLQTNNLVKKGRLLREVLLWPKR